MHLSYALSWEVTRRRAGLLTCSALSPAGDQLAVASKDGNLQFLEVEDGFVAANLAFGSECCVQSILWYSKSNLVLGCDNGGLYETCLKPTNTEYSITMTPILTPFKQRIRLLAFDPSRGLLAVAHSNMVVIYAYKYRSPDSESKWETLELIKGPYNNQSALVNAILFYPTRNGSSNLLIAYAEGGWSVWFQQGSVKRFSPDSSYNICRVGSIALAPDEKSIAVSTLDRAIVTYALDNDGPVLASMKEFNFEDNAETTPAVPVAFTRDGLMLAGTACGDVIVVQAADGEMSAMRHEEVTHIIRVILTRGPKMIVGSTHQDASGFSLKCYCSSVIVAHKPREDELISVSTDEALAGWDSSDSDWKVALSASKQKWRPALSRTARLWILGVMLVTVLVLSVDPPSGVTFDEAKKDSDDTDIMVRTRERHEYWLDFLGRYFRKYLWFQIREWTLWIVQRDVKIAKGVAEVLSDAFKLIGLGLAKWMCERIEVYRVLD
ncbi:hypothetical protein FRC09_002026, partial [Ceratobasidium sp. 395]